MKLINKDGLSSRLSISILFTALAVGFITSELFYRVMYTESLTQAETEISKLYETVAATSSIAAFLNDQELAKEVVNGLKVNGVVLAATLNTKEISVVSGEYDKDDKLYQFKVKSPFTDELVGTLSIARNHNYIANRAQKNASLNTQALLIQGVIIVLVLILNVYILVTKPLSFLSEQLSRIAPPSKKRIAHPAFHQKGELGSLTKDINALLDKTESSLNYELKYRKEIEVLEQRFRLVFDNANNPIVLTDSHGNLILSNHSFENLLAKTKVQKQKNFGLYLQALFEGSSRLESSFKKQLSLSNTAFGECKLQFPDSTDKPIWFQVVATTIRTEDFKDYTEISLHDISNKKQKLEELSNIVDLDPLTKALNRNGLESKIELMNLSYTSYAVIFADLNDFKQLNDTLGHKVGDAVLKKVVNRLNNRLRQDDVICRWGPDEFVLILAQVKEENIDTIVNEIQRDLRRPMIFEQLAEEVHISAALGVAFYPHNSTNSEDLILLADEAMCAAKANMKKHPEQFYKVSGV
ncbi:sensor domain-containing diguanylate cyclase [Paraglaciecola sp. L3A3]|uniref:sensor domain-containing diguanylate cyclase n=1 Tax=Paraglaciecola sp. L3A3 TaxID=2686358 RepID=UPI00131DF81F|nr:sensor domain-containing diguanylate cyclase [Paraglaciecola sp. L3A3]